jgi:conjugative transfer region lipoprotein (TIGR03751 family)
MHPVIKTVLLIWISVGLSACAGPKKQLVAKDAKTMQRVYEEKFGGTGTSDNSHLQRPVQDGDVDLRGYTRDAAVELNTLFPVVPNPTLIMFIYPHVTDAGREVPGYSSRLKMYQGEHYALPGEMRGWD